VIVESHFHEAFQVDLPATTVEREAFSQAYLLCNPISYL